MIPDFNKIPQLNWSKVDQNLAIEGCFMFGGQLQNGEASGEMYILRALKKGLAWSLGSNLCKG